MWDWLGQLQKLKEANIPHACVTITDVGGSAPREIGAKMIVLHSGEFFGTVGGGNLEQTMIEEAKSCLINNESATKTIPLGAKTGQCCGGVVEIFIEVIQPCPQLMVYGAGHVGQAFCQVMEGTPFHIHLFDERNEWLSKQEGSSHVTLHQSAEIEKSLYNDETYSVILTHSHELDYNLLKESLTVPFKYLGMIGSMPKKTRFFNRLKEENVPVELIERITCPIGIDTGGKAPKEIAISLAAQLLGKYHGK